MSPNASRESIPDTRLLKILILLGVSIQMFSRRNVNVFDYDTLPKPRTSYAIALTFLMVTTWLPANRDHELPRAPYYLSETKNVVKF